MYKLQDYISELDSNRFGFAVARIDEYEENPREVISLLKSNDVKLVISRIESHKIQLINSLEELGFRLKDTQLVLRISLSDIRTDFNTSYIDDSLTLREASVDDATIVAEIAEKAFTNYGHYSQNSSLPHENVSQIYYDWAFQSCYLKHTDGRTIIAEHKKKVVGFASLVFNELQTELSLCAVREEYRNMGIFGLILQNCFHLCFILGLPSITTKVHVTNYASFRAFNKADFRLISSLHTLHCWL